MATEGSAKAVVTAMFANLGISITKFVAAALTGSSSMLAEGVHSLADTSNQLLLLFGGKRAKRAATPEHPFGYGRERYVYAFIVSIVLFTLGGLFALYEAWHKWHDPAAITAWQWVPIVVLLIAMVMEGYALRTAVAESNRIRGGRSWAGFIRTAKAPELPVILLEDFGALLGLACALAGVSLTIATGDGRFDAGGTAVIGLLLVVIAMVLAVEMKSLLIGEGAIREHERAIHTALPGDGIASIEQLRTMHLGPDELLVAANITMTPGSTAEDVAIAIDAAEARVRDAVPIAKIIYLEPDLPRPTTAPDRT